MGTLSSLSPPHSPITLHHEDHCHPPLCPPDSGTAAGATPAMFKEAEGETLEYPTAWCPRPAYPRLPVHPICVGNGTLHLKSMMSMAGEERIVFGSSSNAKECKNLVEIASTVPYEMIVVPDDSAANCVLLNGILFHRHKSEYPESAAIFQQLKDVS